LEVPSAFDCSKKDATSSFANYIVPTIYYSCWKNGTHYTPPTAFRSPNSDRMWYLLACKKKKPKPQSRYASYLDIVG
jgi:hypothetical protein